MKTIKWACDTVHEGEFKIDDNATEEEINESVMDDVFNFVSWTWWEE